MAPPDRDAILARRALLLGAALSGITVTPRARAQAAAPPSTGGAPDAGPHDGAPPNAALARDDEPCAPAEPPTEADLASAKAHFRAGRLAFEAGDFAQARAEYRRAFEQSGTLRVLVYLAEAAEREADFVEAKRLYQRMATCVGADPASLPGVDLEVALARVERRLAHLSLSRVPPGARVTIDGRVVSDPTARLEVNPLRQVVRVTRTDGAEHDVVIEPAPGESVQLSLDVFPPDCEREPMLCMPCLSPPPPPPAIRKSHLGLELGGALFLDMVRGETAGRAGYGVRAVPYLAAPLHRMVLLRAGGFAAATRTPGGDFFPLGVDAQIAVGSGKWQMGLGLSGGWVVTSAERSRDERWGPRPGVFVEPYLQAISLRLFEPISAGLRVGHHLGSRANATEEDFGLSYVNVGLFVSVALTQDCERFDEESDCWKRGILDED